MRDAAATRVLLLRHGQVASHSGDVPLTDEGRQTATDAGRQLAKDLHGHVRVLTSVTLRAGETGMLLAAAASEAVPDLDLAEPQTAFALRNPDLYLGGVRVDMVSSVEALADQVPGFSAEDCAAVPFFAKFLLATDRVGWWLRHPSPPGDDAETVAARLVAFARSMLDIPAERHGTVVAVTHSPLLRAVAHVLGGGDSGEPRHLTGWTLDVDDGGRVRAEALDPFA